MQYLRQQKLTRLQIHVIVHNMFGIHFCEPGITENVTFQQKQTHELTESNPEKPAETD